MPDRLGAASRLQEADNLIREGTEKLNSVWQELRDSGMKGSPLTAGLASELRALNNVRQGIYQAQRTLRTQQ